MTHMRQHIPIQELPNGTRLVAGTQESEPHRKERRDRGAAEFASPKPKVQNGGEGSSTGSPAGAPGLALLIVPKGHARRA